jgi:hypothetical protein
LKRIKDSEKKWYWSRRRSGANVMVFWVMKFLIGQEEPCTSLNI